MQSTKDMVFYKEGNTIMSGGLKVNSILLSCNNPIGFANKSKHESSNLDGLLGDSVVPAGLIVLQDHFNNKMSKPNGIKLNNQCIDSTLHEKLMDLQYKHKTSDKKKTRARKNSKNKQTRRQKKG